MTDFYATTTPIMNALDVQHASISQANPDFSGEEVATEMQSHTSVEKMFLFMFAGFRSQSLNGGIAQYIENHYHTFETGYSAVVNTNTDALDKLIELTEVVATTCASKPLASLLNTLKDITIEVDEDEYVELTCNTCGGSGIVDADEDNDDTCPDCHGEGYEEAPNNEYGHLTNTCRDKLEVLTRRYFDIADEVDEVITALLTKQ